MHFSSGRDRRALNRIALLSLLLVLLVIPASPAADAAQSNSETEPRGNSLPEPCRALRNSSQQISDLIQDALTHPTVDSYDSLGDAFAAQNQFDCAAATYDLALAYNPKAWQTRYALGISLLQSGNSERAARELQTVVEQQPDAFMAHNALGLALENLGRLENAREHYETAVRLDPSFALGYYNLAHLASLQTRPIAAVYYAQKAVSLWNRASPNMDWHLVSLIRRITNFNNPSKSCKG